MFKFKYDLNKDNIEINNLNYSLKKLDYIDMIAHCV